MNIALFIMFGGLLQPVRSAIIEVFMLKFSVLGGTMQRMKRGTYKTFWGEKSLMSLVLGSIVFLFISVLPLDASEQNMPYIIGPEDILEIMVWRDPDLTKKVIVRPDGKISFPLIGEVEAGGHTVAWLQEEIRKRIDEYVPGAVVTVMVLDIKGNTFFVVGKVGKPGAHKIGRRINIMQALAKAGGLTPFANESGILILRYTDEGQTKISFDYGEVKKGKNIGQNIWLRDGDVVVVP